MNARSFEDFKVGDVYRSRFGRTISQADNTWFTLLTHNTNPIHFDAHYSAQSEFKRPLVNSFLTLAIVTGLMTPDTSERGVALGIKDVTLPHPLFEGDTLYADTEVMAARASKSRPAWGIVTFKQRGITQDGTVVLEMTRVVMVPARATAGGAPFPEPRA
ncbi:MAG: MaoC family dehydratase [Chloroflexota bacterium]|nr:MaoC family dehydratase [Chloroflexota bacterium]